jgi:hypothetical protein
VVKEMKEKGL